jgi:hypothetical protein
VVAGETVKCTFTNTQRGEILVDKVTSPINDPQVFHFANESVGWAFPLTDAAAPWSSGLVVPGTYTVTESDNPTGWDLTGIVCSDPSSTGSVATRTATFIVEPGEHITCTFTNTQLGRIIVDKVTDPAGSLVSFHFHSATLGNFDLADGSTPFDSGLVIPGSYGVSEVEIPAGWVLESSGCVAITDSPVGNQGAQPQILQVLIDPANITLGPGETILCTFNNLKLPAGSLTRTPLRPTTRCSTSVLPVRGC